MSACMFCKAPLTAENRSREHVVPLWLSRHFGFVDSVVQPTHFDAEQNVLSKRRHTFGNFVNGKVCRDCNNGWMARLETECRPLIIALAQGERRALNLEDFEALLLARWVAKTAYALHFCSNFRRFVPDEHVVPLDKATYRFPAEVFVVAHTFWKGSEFSWSQTNITQIVANGSEPTEAQKTAIKTKAYKISLRVGGFFASIFHNPRPEATTLLWFKRHIPLYPRWSHPVYWNKDEKEWQKDIAIRFLRFDFEIGLALPT